MSDGGFCLTNSKFSEAADAQRNYQWQWMIGDGNDGEKANGSGSKIGIAKDDSQKIEIANDDHYCW